MESIREQLLAAIEAALSGEYRLPQPIDDDVLRCSDDPVCVVQDGVDVATDAEHGETNIEMPVSVARAITVESSETEDLRKACNELLAGIVRDMFADEEFTGLAEGVEYLGGGLVVEAGNRCMAEASFTVRYAHVRGDPYSQA